MSSTDIGMTVASMRIRSFFSPPFSLALAFPVFPITTSKSWLDYSHKFQYMLINVLHEEFSKSLVLVLGEQPSCQLVASRGGGSKHSI